MNEDIINKHTDDVKKCRVKAPEGPCPLCLEQPDSYKRHDYRKRKFRLVSGDFVKIITSFLIRWKCPICRKPFTDYPSFAIPYKRFTLPDMLILSQKYINHEKLTYRKTVIQNRIKIGYEDYDTCFLSHSSIWRWIEFLGGWQEMIKPACRLIRRKDPDNSILKASTLITAFKYRSTHRKTVLEHAIRMIDVCRRYFKFYGHALFPRFGTLTS